MPNHHNNCFAISVLSAPLPFFFFNDTATTEIYTLSLHDALPISLAAQQASAYVPLDHWTMPYIEHLIAARVMADPDRKSTRLNSSHSQISYAVFCLKKKTN